MTAGIELLLGEGDGLLELDDLGEGVADGAGQVGEFEVELEVVCFEGEDFDEFVAEQLGADGEIEGFIGGENADEAIEGGRFFVGGGRLGERPSGIQGVFENEGAVFAGMVGEGVAGLADVFPLEMKDAAYDGGELDGAGLGVFGDDDVGFEIDSVAEQAALLGWDVVHLGVAGVGPGFDDGDGAGQQVFAGAVSEADAVEGMGGEDVAVVDGDFFDVDVVGDDGDHGGLLAFDGNVADVVLEEFAEAGGRGGGDDRGDGIDGSRFDHLGGALLIAIGEELVGDLGLTSAATALADGLAGAELIGGRRVGGFLLDLLKIVGGDSVLVGLGGEAGVELRGDERAGNIKGVIEILDEGDGTAADEGEIDVGPVAVGLVFDDGPALDFAAGCGGGCGGGCVFFGGRGGVVEDEAVAGFPDGGFDDVADADAAIALAIEADFDGLFVLAACLGEGCERGVEFLV